MGYRYGGCLEWWYMLNKALKGGGRKDTEMEEKGASQGE
jgi:hypothetical protein